MKKHFNLRITGLVQGVFFRAHTRQKADELNIKGFVRNHPDGSVYIECEGEDEPLANFIKWCHSGPSRAHVEKVETREGDFKAYKIFYIDK